MNAFLERFRPVFEGEGAGSGDGGGGGGDGGDWTPPEGLPADYAGASADESLAKLLPAYSEATTRADGLRDKLAKMPSAPKTADDYTLTPDEKLQPYFTDLPNNPAWNNARKAAHAAGISNDQLGQLINGVYGPMIDEGLIAAPFDPKTEVQSFMKATGLQGPEAQAALVEAEAFSKGLAAQLQDVPQDLQADVSALLYSMTETGAGNVLLRALAGRLSDVGIRVSGEGQNTGPISREEAKQLATDPRIDPANRDHPDKDRRFDPALRKQFDDFYAG